MQQAKRVAKNTIVLYVQMGITVFMSLYTTRLVLAMLGVEDFGVYNLVAGTISMLVFLNTAMTAASLRFMSYSQGEGDIEKQKSIFNISIVLHFIIGLIIIVILEIGGHFLFNGILNIDPERIQAAKMVYHFMVGSTFLMVIGVPYDAVINAHENMLMVAVLRIVEVTFKMAIALFITYYDTFDKLIVYSFLMAIIYAVLFSVRMFYCHKKYLEVVVNFKIYYRKPLFKEMTSFAGYSFMGSSSSIVANYGQGLILNIFFGTTINAAQAIANQVSGQLGVFAGTMQKALNPMIAKSEGNGDRELMLKASMFGSKSSFFLLMLTFIPFLIEMPYIFGLWLKEVPEYAVIFCRLLLLRNLIDQLYVTLTTAISAEGNIRKYQKISAIVNFSPLIITYLLFELNFPPYVLYFVFILFSIVSCTVVIYFSKINFDLPVLFYLKNVVLRSVFSFILVMFISIVSIYFFEEGFFRLLIVSLISLISFVLIVWNIGFTIDEQLLVKKLINELLNKLKLRGI